MDRARLAYRNDGNVLPYNLSVLEQVKGSKGRLNFGYDAAGRFVVKVSPKWSLRLWLQNTFMRRKFRAVLHDQALHTLRSDSVATSLKDRLVKDITSGAFPFVSRKEMNRAVHQSAEKLEMIPGGLGLLPGFSDEIANARTGLQQEADRLNQKLPDVNLADVQAFLHYHITLVVLGKELEQSEQDNYERILEHFRASGQVGLFDGAIVRERHRIFQRLMRQYPDNYPQHLYSLPILDPNTQQAQLLRSYIANIYSKVHRPLSETGDQPDLVTADEAEFFKNWQSESYSAGLFANRRIPGAADLESGWDNAGGFAGEKAFERLDLVAAEQTLKHMNELWKQLKTLPSDSPAHKNVQAQLQQLEQDNAELIKTLALGRAQYFRVQTSMGRRWAPDFLRAEAHTGARFSRYYQNLERISELRFAPVYQAQLEQLKEEHDRVENHPRVVIEGAGPVGLITAIKQYQAGADVTLLEQRDTLYSRSQILRLDRQWMNDLKFYLGAQYDELFDTEDGIGHIRPDGSGHIVTSALEDALHRRLTELMSVASPSGEEPVPLRRLAAHRVMDVHAPAGEQKAYTITARYDRRYDPLQSSEDEPREELVIPADMLVCAGGKNSPTRNQFFVSRVRTEEKYYGVASWSDKQIGGPQQDAFPVIQDIVVLDKKFKDIYMNRLRDSLHPVHGSAGSLMSDACRYGLLEYFDVSERDLLKLQGSVTDEDEAVLLKRARLRKLAGLGAEAVSLPEALAACEGQVTQMRLFENRDMTYLGMAVPEQIWRVVGALEESLKEQGVSPDEIRQVRPLTVQAWFQAVAERKGVAQKMHLNTLNMDKRFASFFPVTQDSVTQGMADFSDQGTGAKLDVMVVGDAAASPHFMSASGLTGGRLSSEAVVDYTRAVAEKGRSEEASDYLRARISDVSEYVLSRGRGALKEASIEQQWQSSSDKTMRTMNGLVEACQKPEWNKPYRVFREQEGQYRVEAGGKDYILVVNLDGTIQPWESAGSLAAVSTFKAFELNMLGGQQVKQK